MSMRTILVVAVMVLLALATGASLFAQAPVR